MKPRTALFACSGLAVLGSLPLLALYVALLNGFADVVGAPMIGAFGLATVALVSLPATVLGIRRMRSNAELPRALMIGSGLLSMLVLLTALLAAVASASRGVL